MKTKKSVAGHQGDVQFKSLDALPKGATKIQNKPIALGEHSGHCHVLTGDVELFEIEGRIVAVVGKQEARLQHIHESKLTEKSWTSKKEIQKADHDSHLLEEGVYEFYIQNSFNPYKKEMEKVVD